MTLWFKIMRQKYIRLVIQQNGLAQVNLLTWIKPYFRFYNI